MTSGADAAQAAGPLIHWGLRPHAGPTQEPESQQLVDRYFNDLAFRATVRQMAEGLGLLLLDVSEHVLVLAPDADKDEAGDARMRVINADGSEAEMCGNGLRCVAKYLHDQWPRFQEAERLWIDTGAGLLLCDLTRGEDRLVSSVTADMGRPRQEPDGLGVDRGEPVTARLTTFR